MTGVKQARFNRLRVALCHDYLIKIGGAERVLDVLHEMFPEAPVYTLLYDEEQTLGHYKKWNIRTSWLQKAPGVHKLVDYYRAMMPQAVESFDLGDYDLVISDASSFIKGVLTGTDTLHISYIHTPTRFLWFDIKSHVSRGKFGAPAKMIIPAILHRIRQWDTISAARPDILIANSETTRERIKKFYHRDSSVIYPPVDISRFNARNRKPEDFFLIIGRLEPHKDIDLAIKAANKTGHKLKIIGTGTDEAYLQKLAGPTVTFLGRVSDADIVQYLYKARALIAPQREDFGITLVESLAAGCPVIARDIGGAREIVESGENGILLRDISAESLGDALDSFRDQFEAKVCAKKAEQFSTDKFKTNIEALLDNAL